MIKIHSIYNRVLHALLPAVIACGIGTSCTDDYFDNSVSSGGMATLNIQLPKAVEPDSRVISARIIAFQAGGAGTSGVLQQNLLIIGASVNFQVSLPIGNSNIYIIGNPPLDLGLESVRTEADLVAKMATWEVAKVTPHIMVESYRNIRIEKDMVKDNNGNIITLGQGLKRLISKLTVNLEYQSLGGKELVIDSVTIGNRAAYSALLPRTFEGNTYVSSAADRISQFTETETTGGVTTYQAFDFYLSEYLLNADHADHSTCMHIHVHSEGNENDRSVYPVYIGDWFGQGITYDDFNNSDTPAKLVGINGLSVTRNKHYTLTCKLKGAEQTGMQIETNVEEWTVVNVNGNITAPYFNIAFTDIMINPLKVLGTPVSYVASVPQDSISVVITNNPNNRFSYTISDRFINFIHSRLDVDSLTTAAGLPIRGMAVVTVRDGNARIVKNIALGVFNPISRFYVRGMEPNQDYSTTVPASAIDNNWSMDWASAVGYNNLYGGATTTLHGVNPNSTVMGEAFVDSYLGCGGYWEVGRDDRNTGRGLWRLPDGGADNSEAARLAVLLQHLNVNSLRFDVTAHGSSIWTSTEDGSSMAKAILHGGTPVLAASNKTATNFVRCVRELDSTTSTGGSSFLSVSHNVYEVAPITYRTTIGTVPIYYESDGPVSISLLDENGNDISNQGLGMPFIGFSADTEDILYGTTEPSIVFPNINYVKKIKGYFCLHSALYGSEASHTSLGDLKGPMPSELRKQKYILLFKSGDLSKAIKINIVNPLAVTDAGYLSMEKAMGIGNLYAGYDYILKTRIATGTDPKMIHLSMPVSDTTTGCGGYYENTSTDRYTGVGNWFVAPLLLDLGTSYPANYNRWSSQLGGYFDVGNLDKIYGEGGGFKDVAPDGIRNGEYWCNDFGTELYSHFTIIALTGSKQLTDKRGNPSAYVRCQRRLNADILSLSTQNVELTPGATKEIIFYTDATSIANLSSSDILHISGTNPAFTTTTTTTNSGRIVVNCLNGAASGSEANLLVRTVGKSKRGETYKIIKLKVK